MLVNLNIVKMKKDLIYYFDMLKDKSAYELGSLLFVDILPIAKVISTALK